MFYRWKSIKKSYKGNKFKIIAPTWSENFEFPDGSYSVSGIQDLFEHIIKNHQKVTDNPPIRIYVNKKENRAIFKIKVVYYLKPLTPETITLFGRNKSKIIKDKDDKNVPHLENTQEVLVLCNTFNNDYQQDSRVFYTFVSEKSFS